MKALQGRPIGYMGAQKSKCENHINEHEISLDTEPGTSISSGMTEPEFESLITTLSKC